MTRLLATLAAVLMSVGLVAGCGQGQNGSASNSTTQSGNIGVSNGQEDQANCTGTAKHDCEDPDYTHCADTATPVPNIAIGPVPTESMDVKLPDGQVYGKLQVRQSSGCATIWGRVQDITAPAPGKRLHIDLTRPSDSATANFSTTKGAATFARNVVFGNMLSFTPGCEVVRAYVEDGSAKGPVAETACVPAPPTR